MQQREETRDGLENVVGGHVVVSPVLNIEADRVANNGSDMERTCSAHALLQLFQAGLLL
jgi:hypothetical protein